MVIKEKLEGDLKKYFGYDNYRPGQLDIISSIVSKKDTLAILPTGGGKSICFQIPALNFSGVTLVVSPLISLMKDQVDSLMRKNISATFLNSTLSREEINRRTKDILDGKIKLIYIAPERLSSDSFEQICRNIQISFISIDEAHCISAWGHDFRPSYLEISDFINKLNQRPIIAAFTATATSRVRKDIIKQLELRKSKVFTGSFQRENLFFEVERVDEAYKYYALMNSLKQYSNNAVGIVFAQTRKQVEKIALEIQKIIPNTKYYHAGLEKGEREKVQESFMKGETQVIVATNAFGMGVDKSDVRFVIHLGFPASLENYYQEAGRAGRDGDNSICKIIYSMKDIRSRQIQLQDKYPDKRIFKKVLQFVNRYKTNIRLQRKQIEQESGCKTTNRMLKNILDELLKLNYLEYEWMGSEFNANTNVIKRFNVLKKVNFRKKKKMKNWEFERLDAMLNYLLTLGCRQKVVLNYFGERPKELCGNCDNCRN